MTQSQGGRWSESDLELHHRFMGAIEPVRVGLLSILEHVERLRERHGHQPASGSAAADEIAQEPSFIGPLGGRPVLTARHLGELQLLAASDHFDALCRLLAMQETVLFADKVLARVGIESAARAFWLLDSRLDARRRVARGMTERLHDDFQADAMFGEAGRAERMSRRNELLQKASAAQLEYTTPKKHAAWVLEERPGATKVMMRLLDGGVPGESLGTSAQRYLSTFVHATVLGLQSAIPRDELLDLGAGEASARLASSSSDVNSLLALASLAWSISAGAYVRHMGWEDSDWLRDLHNHALIIRRFVPSAES